MKDVSNLHFIAKTFVPYFLENIVCFVYIEKNIDRTEKNDINNKNLLAP